jgi:hypothetical protein
MHQFRFLIVIAACLLSTTLVAPPGTGIVVDRLGQVYFVDMVSGVWKLDAHGALTHMPGPAFHWMTADESNRFGGVALPSGPAGDVARIGISPTLLLASDFPIALGQDGNLYYPSHVPGAPVEMFKLSSAGAKSTVANLSAGTSPPLRDVNGIAAGPDGSVFYTEDAAIRRIGRRGQVSTIVAMARCPSPPPGRAQDRPLLRGLAVDGGGTSYVAATGCGAVLKVTAAGQVTVLPQVPDAWAPTGVALFGNDVYVLEFQDGQSDDRQAMLPRVRKIGADGRTSILASVTRHGGR